MSEAARRRELASAVGRLVRTEMKDGGKKLQGVLECHDSAQMERTKNALRAKGWRFVRSSGNSILMEVDL